MSLILFFDPCLAHFYLLFEFGCVHRLLWSILDSFIIKFDWLLDWMETLDCWSAEVAHQARIGKNSIYKASTIHVLISQMFSVVKRKAGNTEVRRLLSQLCWNLLQASSSQTIRFSSLNNKQLIFAVFSTEYRRKRVCKSCILVLFTFYTTS